MNKQDRNTALTIGLVLLVCIVALVAVGSWLWQAVSPSVNSGLEVLGLYVSRATTSYNFEVPGQDVVVVETPEEQEQEEPQIDTEVVEEEELPITNQAVVDHNFFVDQLITPKQYDPEDFFKQDRILIDVMDAGYFATDANRLDLTVEIPKLGIDTRIYSDLPARFALQNGFVIHPNSNQVGEGEVILACYRQYQLPTSNASCYYIDTLAKGDEINVVSNGQTLNYQVRGVHSLSLAARDIYTANGGAEYLKIVAIDLVDPKYHRIVVLAEQVTD